MVTITLEEAKQHLIIDDNEDDTYITSLIDVAEEYIEKSYDVSITDIVTANSNIVPVTLKHCVKILVADFYEHRNLNTTSNVSPKIVPTLRNLMNIYINHFCNENSSTTSAN